MMCNHTLSKTNQIATINYVEEISKILFIKLHFLIWCKNSQKI